MGGSRETGEYGLFVMIAWKEYEGYEEYVYIEKIIPIFVLGKMGIVAALYRVFID